MIKRYTKNGIDFVKAGAMIEKDGKFYYCVSEKWLTDNGYLLYTEVREDGTDGEKEGCWVHYLGAPYVAPEPEPVAVPEPTAEELAAKAEAERVAGINAQIEALQAQLAETDYKVIKCSECQLVGEELPYDVTELHTERQAIRDQINELQEERDVTSGNS